MRMFAFARRALREDARSKGTYVLRGLVVVVMLFAVVQAHMTERMFGAPGHLLFSWISWGMLVLVGLSGIGYFPSIITDEKEAGTLGLLQMAGLSPLSILLGKGGSRLLLAVLLLLVQVPFTMLAVTLGGVTYRQILSSYAALTSFLVFMASLGLLTSVVFRKQTTAALVAFLGVFGFLAGPHAAKGLAEWMVDTRRLARDGVLARLTSSTAELLIDASPASRLQQVLGSGFTGAVLGLQFWVNLALGAALFALAWAVFGVCNREQKAVGPTRGLLARRRSVFRKLRAGRPGRFAIVWKDYNFMAAGRLLLIARLLLPPVALLLSVPVVRMFGGRFDWQDGGVFLLVVALLCGGIEAAIQASRTFNLEWRWETMSAVFGTPHSIRSVAYRKVLGTFLPLLPYALWAGTGVMWIGQLHDFIDAVSSVEFFIGVCYLLVFVHSVVLLSLLLRHAALLISFFVFLFVPQLFAFLLFALFNLLGAGEFVEELMIVVLLTGIAVMHELILRRLRVLVARE